MILGHILESSVTRASDYTYLTDSILEFSEDDSCYGIPDTEETSDITKMTTVSDLFGVLIVSCNNHYLTTTIVKNDSATLVWRYLFSAKPATHGYELCFTVHDSSLLINLSSLLTHLLYYYPIKDPPAFVIPEMAKFMQKKYVKFILNGCPNGKEDLKWLR